MKTITLLFILSMTSQSILAQDWQVYQAEQNITQLTYQTYNTVSIQLDDVQAWSKISFRAKGAKVNKLSDRGQITLYPTASLVQLSVYAHGKLAKQLDFKTNMPTVHIQPSAKLPITLYQNWHNRLNINTLTGNMSSNIHFESEELRIIDTLANELVLIPKNNIETATLTIFDGEQQIGSQQFKVESLRFQSPQLLSNWQTVDLAIGISIATVVANNWNLKIQLSANPKFSSIYSNTVRVTKFRIIATRGSREMETINSTNDTLSTDQLFPWLLLGDRLIVEITEITITHQGKTMRLNLNYLCNIPLF